MTGTIGNALVIKKFAFTEKKQTPGSYFVAVLAVVDMYSSIIVPLLYGSRFVYGFPQYESIIWPWGKGMCYILRASDGIVYYISAMLLAAISLERTRYEKCIAIHWGSLPFVYNLITKNFELQNLRHLKLRH